MYEQVEKPKENKSRIVANSVSQKKDSSQQGTFFQDKRGMLSFSDNRMVVDRLLQRKMEISATSEAAPIQRAINKTGIVDESDHVTGEMNYSFKWNGSNPHDNGYIIQFIDRTEIVYVGNNANVTNVQYWEAWKITNGVIFNGGQDLSGVRHDTWANGVMPQGSHGEIVMNAQVYYSAQVPTNMAFGGVGMAGTLLSGKSAPNVPHTNLFFHMHTFKWDRRLSENNIDNVILKELKAELELSSKAEILDVNFDWDQFADDVNGHDPDLQWEADDIMVRATLLIDSIA